MFVQLGLVNCLRQIGRSLLVLLGMVLAAISLTSALSFREGELQNSYQFHRDLLGGEILVSPVRWLGQRSADATDGGQVAYRQLPATGLSWLETFYPELYRDGYLTSPETAVRQAFTEAEVAALRAHPGIAGVTISQQLPADMTSLWLPYDKYSAFTVLPLPRAGLLQAAVEGAAGLRPFTVSAYAEADVPLVWMNSFVSVPDELLAPVAASMDNDSLVYDRENVFPTPEQLGRIRWAQARWRVVAGMQLPKAGEKVSLLFPGMRLDQNGEYVPDYSHPVSIEAQMAGQVAMPTRTLAWPHGLRIIDSETAYLHASNLYVTPEVWEQIWRKLAGSERPPLYNVTLQISDMGQLQQTMQSLQDSFPQFSFIDVQSFAERMELTSRLDFFYRAPSYVYSPAKDASLAVPTELGKVTGLLFFLIAGMLVASNMLTGAAARRMEIGILKTLGARRRDIVAMTLTEVLLLAVIGSSTGFLLVRLAGTAIEVSNHVPWPEILGRTAQEGGLVIGLASLTALLFALLPAIRLANLTVMEVLRGD